MFRRKLLILASALLIGLMSAVPTFAASNSVSDLRLAPGATVCIGPLSATSSANAQGIANAGGAHFTVYNGAVNATNPIYIAFNSLGFNANFTTSFWSSSRSSTLITVPGPNWAWLTRAPGRRPGV